MYALFLLATLFYFVNVGAFFSKLFYHCIFKVSFMQKPRGAHLALQSLYGGDA